MPEEESVCYRVGKIICASVMRCCGVAENTHCLFELVDVCGMCLKASERLNIMSGFWRQFAVRS
jgi:hypothetical protein